MNNPEKCDKRQKEVKTTRTGESKEEFRCMDSRNVDHHLKIVDPPTCEGCPLLAAKIDLEKGCGAKASQPGRHWSEELLSVQQIARDARPGQNMADPDLGFEQPCHHRWDGKCRITGRPITPDICKACDQETAEHMATLPEMGVGYLNEVKEWIRLGRPVRTQERVQEILKICQGDPDSPDPEKRKPCELYDPVKEACKKCGCAMNDSSWAVRNGIKMLNKICPMGLWR
jgi:hypothetical protein